MKVELKIDESFEETKVVIYSNKLSVLKIFVFGRNKIVW